MRLHRKGSGVPANPVQSFQVRVNVSLGKFVLVRGMEVYELNDVGALIWQHCDGEHAVEEIARVVRDRYGVSQAEALRDVTEYVGDLRRADLLE
jgi:Coenzyme PQQ synthesis protein D (PqqD)